MSRWRAFVDVLDEILNDNGSAPAAPETAPHTAHAARVASTPLYAYVPNRTPNRFWATPARPRTTQLRDALDSFKRLTQKPAAAGQPAGRPAATQTIDPPRQGRTLKPAEETALQTLVRLGAALDRGFTTRELRSTFRTLAQRYHPDRHPYASDAERKRLGAMFAELTAAYGTLLESSPT
jgi:hypothetical protein